ncbi:expressed unknown protein [Ectocarpus siliculosus]|uniref:Uncharacterized protein n=1 Tax=Ectocarpus siliculosus TaxID=2880 RepID=D7FSJ7_ECTSI|nr:expressed unknown protein [Ectocarpus siliculosus]|eukprot:CBJ31138.1 expressed unknown protein [Ectocarpus siliculosus]
MGSFSRERLEEQATLAPVRMWANIWQILGVTMIPIFTVGTGLSMASRAEDAGVIAVRDGVVVQDKGCPHAISPDEADIRKSTPSWPGGVLTLTSLYQVDNHEDLQACMNNVKMRGCEAVYFQGSFGGEEYCSTPRHRLPADEEEPGLLVAGSTSPLETKRARSLVFHFRSGDVFKPRKDFHFQTYGQPPLLYVLAVIASKKWSNLTFITNGEHERLLNPTFRVIEELISQGILGTNGTIVETYKKRSLWEDLQAMLCADALSVAHSTLTNLLLAHSRAKMFFLPWGCEPQIGDMMIPRFVSASMICLQRPEVEVYGIEWRTTSNAYTVYNKWDPSVNQLEMIVSDDLKGVQHCCN